MEVVVGSIWSSVTVLHRILHGAMGSIAFVDTISILEEILPLSLQSTPESPIWDTSVHSDVDTMHPSNREVGVCSLETS